MIDIESVSINNGVDKIVIHITIIDIVKQTGHFATFNHLIHLLILPIFQFISYQVTFRDWLTNHITHTLHTSILFLCFLIIQSSQILVDPTKPNPIVISIENSIETLKKYLT